LAEKIIEILNLDIRPHWAKDYIDDIAAEIRRYGEDIKLRLASKSMDLVQTVVKEAKEEGFAQAKSMALKITNANNDRSGGWTGCGCHVEIEEMKMSEDKK